MCRISTTLGVGRIVRRGLLVMVSLLFVVDIWADVLPIHPVGAVPDLSVTSKKTYDHGYKYGRMPISYYAPAVVNEENSPSQEICLSPPPKKNIYSKTKKQLRIFTTMTTTVCTTAAETWAVNTGDRAVMCAPTGPGGGPITGGDGDNKPGLEVPIADASWIMMILAGMYMFYKRWRMVRG